MSEKEPFIQHCFFISNVFKDRSRRKLIISWRGRGSNEDNVYILFWFLSFFFPTFFPSNNCSESNYTASKSVVTRIFPNTEHVTSLFLLWGWGRSTASRKIWPFLFLLRSHIRNNPFKRKRANNKTCTFASLFCFFGPECVIYKSYCGQKKLWKTEW